MEFLVRFMQVHESFRKPELEALAELHNLNLEVIEYTESVGHGPCKYSAIVLFAFGFLQLLKSRHAISY